MSTASVRTCEECGALFSGDASRCSLCGWPVDAPEEISQGAGEEVQETVPAENEARETVLAAYCKGCDRENPDGSLFCSMCGSPLQELPKPEPSLWDEVPGTTKTERPVEREVWIIAGAGMVLVALLFMVTRVSKTLDARTDAEVATEQALPPTEEAISPALASQIEAIDAEIAQLDGVAQINRRRGKIFLLASEGRLDLAAREQQVIAQVLGVVEEWNHAGDMYYEWMTSAVDQRTKAQAAMLAVAAYEQVLVQDPENLNVRTDMATAYLHTGQPMQGVEEIKRVLEVDSQHLNANYNYGIMLTWINRPEKAIEQFEKVMALADDTTAHFQQARDAIRTIRERGGS